MTNSTLCYVHYCIERQVISRQKPFIVPYILIQWVGMILSKNRIWLLDKYILYDISRIEVETFFKVSTFWSKLDEGSNASWATFKVKVSPFIFFTFLICYYVSIIWSKPIWNSTLNFFYPYLDIFFSLNYNLIENRDIFSSKQKDIYENLNVTSSIV